MPTYVTLLNFTDQGIRNIKDSPKRAEAYKNLAKEHGCTVKEILWIHGHYDIVTIVEAPDEAAASALSLSRLDGQVDSFTHCMAAPGSLPRFVASTRGTTRHSVATQCESESRTVRCACRGRRAQR